VNHKPNIAAICCPLWVIAAIQCASLMHDIDATPQSAARNIVVLLFIVGASGVTAIINYFRT
jgi:hypothetical protein